MVLGISVFFVQLVFLCFCSALFCLFLRSIFSFSPYLLSASSLAILPSSFSSGSGKTTFLNDVYASHKCTYIRQYHSARPYITVSKIPNFDPAQLPYWEIYEREGTANSIKVGGTMAGEFTAGLSGGQRKMLLFELIYQRTQNQKQLLSKFSPCYHLVCSCFYVLSESDRF